jgi:mono/diheme cytochrome c family protein
LRKKDDVMSTSRLLWVSFLAVALSATLACSQGETKPKGAAEPVPAEFQAGEQKFAANCAVCHGIGGVGTNQGPPLVHKIYEPNHHGDAAFQRAAANGVKAHHWQFGDMPKIDAVTPDDVEQIVQYVRWLQKQAGIF